MLISFGKAKTVLGLLALAGTLGETPYREAPQREPSQRILMIRVSQETSPGAGNFDNNVLGFIRALNTNGIASDFYMYEKAGPNYGNSEPGLKNNTCHVFFVNGSDGLTLFVVMNKPNDVQHSTDGEAQTRFDLSGGSASVVLSDDQGETNASEGGTVFISQQSWSSDNTDGEVIGALPVGFTLLGQFTSAPHGVNGWEVISADGLRIPLSLVPGQRVRLDVAPLAVKVKQDH